MRVPRTGMLAMDDSYELPTAPAFAHKLHNLLPLRICDVGIQDTRYPSESSGGLAMSLVFAGICSHAPGITGRAHLADPVARDEFHAQFRRMGEALDAARPDAVVVVAAEHFANFFMNNMPAYAIGPS